MVNFVRLQSGVILDLLHHPYPEALFAEDGKTFIWFVYDADKVHAKQHQEPYQQYSESFWALIHKGDFVGLYDGNRYVIRPVKAAVLQGMSEKTLNPIRAIYVKNKDHLDLVARRNDKGEMEGLGHLYRIN